MTTTASQAEGDGLDGHAGREDRTPADPAGQDARDRGDDDRHPRPRQRPEAGLERAVALDHLEELAEQEHRSEHPEEHQERDGVGRAERAAPEDAEREHRLGGPGLPGQERDEQRRCPRRSQPATWDAGPAEVVAVDDAPHDREQAGADEAEARDVEPTFGAVALGQAQRGERHHDEADRHVEPEDPVPVEALGDGATDDRSDRDGQAGDAAPRPEREGSTLRRDRGGQDGQGERGDERAADALDGPGEDEDVGGRGQGGQGRAAGEDGHADQEDPLAAESVTEGGAGQQQDGEGERVGVDHPLEVGQGGAEVGLDDGQGGRDDEVVEGDHEQGDRR